jgi:hypothetical protein
MFKRLNANVIYEKTQRDGCDHTEWAATLQLPVFRMYATGRADVPDAYAKRELNARIMHHLYGELKVILAELGIHARKGAVLGEGIDEIRYLEERAFEIINGEAERTLHHG